MRAEKIKLSVKLLKTLAYSLMQLRALGHLGTQLPNLVDDALDDLDKLRILLVLVGEEP